MVFLAAFGPLALAQLPIDSQLAAEIAKIRAIDNHAHPVRPVSGATKTPTTTLYLSKRWSPPPTRFEFATGFAAHPGRMATLFGYRYSDFAPEHVRELQQRKKQLMQEKGAGYANWVLDQFGIETMLANRVAMGPGLAPPRFLWVPFEDALMYPLNNSSLAAKNSDRKAFFADEDRLLQRYLKESGYSESPASFDDYLKKVVTATLERHQRAGRNRR